MNAAHLHLLLNHLPVYGTIFVALLVAWGTWRGSREVRRVAAGAAVLVAVFSYPVFLTGEPAEEGVEDYGWYNERQVHEHEERAELSLAVVLVTGGIAAFSLWYSRAGRPLTTPLAGLTLAALLLSAALFAWTALAGGAIRHSEIRPGVSAADSIGDAGGGPGRADHDDDHN